MADGTDALATRVEGERAVGWDSYTGRGRGAKKEAGLDGHALAALVTFVAAGRYRGAKVVQSTPSLASRANAVPAAVVVVFATSGNGSTRAGGGAPTEPLLQGRARATIVRGGTAGWDRHTRVGFRAPRVTGGEAHAVAALVIIIGAIHRHAKALSGRGAKGEASHQGDAVAA